MDTHFEASPDLDRHDAPLSARLPDEPDLDTADAGGAVPREKLAPVESVRARKPGRGALLAGAAIVGVCVIAGGVFVLSPYNHLVPVPAKVAAVVHNVAQEAGIKLERPLAPSASLASVALPDRPNTVAVPKYVPKGRNENLNELLAMGPSGAPASTAAAPSSSRTAAGVPAAAPDGPRIIPHEPGTSVAAEPASALAAVAAPAAPASPNQSIPARPTSDITDAIIRAVQGHPEPGAEPVPSPQAQRPAAPAAAALAEPVRVAPEPVVVAPVQQVVAAPVPVPDTDAASRAQRLLAGPMSSDEQVKVLELVTQMATMVRDQRTQIGALRADFAKTKLDDQARLADFARRVDLAEATRAVAAATGNDSVTIPLPPAPMGPNPAAVRPVMAMGPVTVTRADMAVPAAASEAKHYRVQAASPGLALLSEVERGGGDGAQIQVIVGGTIPGYGRVKSIAQIGSSWSVKTESGDIR